MSDERTDPDLSTLDLRRKRRKRDEISGLRQRFEQHSETLRQLAESAPTEWLGRRYETLRGDVEIAISRLSQIEPEETPEERPGDPFDERLDLNATRPTASRLFEGHEKRMVLSGADETESNTPRLILGLALVLLIAISAVVFWNRGSTPELADDAGTVATEPEQAVEVVETPVFDILVVEPASFDFGILNKGERSSNSFQIVNDSDQPVAIEVGRSACHCLWYTYNREIPARGRSELTITIDSGRAPRGTVEENILIASHEGLGSTTVRVIATIQ